MPKFKRFRLVLDRKSSTKKNNASDVILQKQESLPNFSKLLIDPRSFTIPTCLNHLIDGSRGHDNKKFWSNRIKVILKIQEPPKDTNFSSCVTINKQQSCIGLIDPTPSRRSSHATNNHVNLFPFDSILTDADPPNILSIQALNNSIFELFRGKDSCIFSFGHSGLGKTRTMIGSDKQIGELGVIPHALGLVYRLIELRNNSNSSTSTINYSISISAIVVNRTGVICDLLQSQSNTKKNDSSSSKSSSRTAVGPVELTAVNLKEASRILDMILAARLSLAENLANMNNNGGSNGNECEKMSHLRMIIHLYQSSSACIQTGNHEWSGANRIDTSSSNVTKSRLILLDLGSGRSSSDDSLNYPGNLSVQGMCKVLLALYTSQLHIPHKDNQLTQIMRDSIHTGSHAVMLLHISGKQQNYNETLQVVQLASKLHRTCRGRSSRSASSNHQSGNQQHQYQLDETTSSYSSSSSGSRRKPRPHMGISGVGGGSGGRRSCGATSSSASELDITSASEMSSCCETVIYRGPSARNSDHNVTLSVSETSDYGDSTKLNPRTRTVSGSGSISNDSGSNNNYCSPSILRRRRMSPRTNARAWPLSPSGSTNNNVIGSQPIQLPNAASSKSPNLDSNSVSPNTAELWVDGPNAVYKQQQTQVLLTSGSEQKHELQRPLDPELNRCPMKMVSKETQYAEEWERSSSSLAEEEVETMENASSLPINPATNPSSTTSISGNSSASTSATSSLSNTLDRAHKEPRPLSDISECTEETESVRATSSVQEGDTRSSNGLEDENEDGFYGINRGKVGDNLSPNLGDIDQLLDTATNQFNQLHLPGKEMTSVATSPLLSRSNIILNQRQNNNSKHKYSQLDQTSINESSDFTPGNRINLSNMNNSLVGMTTKNQIKLQSSSPCQQIIINNDIIITHNNNDNKNNNNNNNHKKDESDCNNKRDIKINADNDMDDNEKLKPIDYHHNNDNNNNNNNNKLSISKSHSNTATGSIVHYHSAEESTRRFSKSSTSEQKARSSKRNCKKCKQHISASTGGQSEGSISTSHHHSRRHHRTNSSNAQQKSMTSSCSSTDFNRVASWIETVEKEINTSPLDSEQPPNPSIASANLQTLFNTTNYQPRETDVLTTANSEPPTTRIPPTPSFYYPPPGQGSHPDISLNYPLMSNTAPHQYSYYEPTIQQHQANTGSSMYYTPINYNHLPLPPVPPTTNLDLHNPGPASSATPTPTTTTTKPKSKTLPRDLYADINLATGCPTSPIKRNNSDLYANPIKYPTSITPDNTKITNKKESSKNLVSLLFGPILNLKQKMSRNSSKSSPLQQPPVISDPLPPSQGPHQPSYTAAQVYHSQNTHQPAEWPPHVQHHFNSQHNNQIFISSPYNLMTAPKTGHVLPTESSGHGSDSSSTHRGGHTVNLAAHSAHKSQPNLSSNRQLRKTAMTCVNRPSNSRQTTATSNNNPPLSGRQQRRPTSSGYGSIIMKNSNSMGGGGGGDSSELSSHNDSSSEYSNYPMGALLPANTSGLGKLRHSRSLSNCKSSTVDPLQPTSYPCSTPQQQQQQQVNAGMHLQIQPAQHSGFSRSHTHLHTGSSHTNLVPMVVPRPENSPANEMPPQFTDYQQNVRIAENLIFQEKLRMTVTEERRTVIQLIEINRLRGLCIDPAIMNLTCFKGVDNIEVTNAEQRAHCEMLIQTVENEILELKQKLQHAQKHLVLVTSFDSSHQPPPSAASSHTTT